MTGISANWTGWRIGPWGLCQMCRSANCAGDRVDQVSWERSSSVWCPSANRSSTLARPPTAST